MQCPAHPWYRGDDEPHSHWDGGLPSNADCLKCWQVWQDKQTALLTEHAAKQIARCLWLELTMRRP